MSAPDGVTTRRAVTADDIDWTAEPHPKPKRPRRGRSGGRIGSVEVLAAPYLEVRSWQETAPPRQQYE